jgi:hypothetical protein
VWLCTSLSNLCRLKVNHLEFHRDRRFKPTSYHVQLPSQIRRQALARRSSLCAGRLNEDFSTESSDGRMSVGKWGTSEKAPTAEVRPTRSAPSTGQKRGRPCDQLPRKPCPRRSISCISTTGIAGAIQVNVPTLGRWYLLQGSAVAISRTTGTYASLIGDLSQRKDGRGRDRRKAPILTRSHVPVSLFGLTGGGKYNLILLE